MDNALLFGPVPSRRLGRSLGVNHIPPKTCSYACVYCQLGRTSQLRINRQTFYDPEMLADEVRAKLATLDVAEEPVDYLTLVPDGEPTLDNNLDRLLTTLKQLGIPLAVISNASLLTIPEVRAALNMADWVSLKVDAVCESAWRKVDRPHGHLRLAHILEGIRDFAQAFPGTLVTETMLVAGANDAVPTLEATAAFLGEVQPDIAYIGIPTRPPAEPWVQSPDMQTINRAYQIFSAHVPQVEYLIGYEGNAFAATGDPVADLLSITAVHPMREHAVAALLARTGADWDVVRTLLTSGALIAMPYDGHTFYLRNLHASH